jgi:hypothetical protein
MLEEPKDQHVLPSKVQQLHQTKALDALLAVA